MLHKTHIVVYKTIARARSAFYWPGISVVIKEICLKCETCLKYSTKQRKESLGLVPVVQKYGMLWHLTPLNSNAIVTLSLPGILVDI